MRIKYIILLALWLMALTVHAGDFASGGLVYSFRPQFGEVEVDDNIIDGLNAYEGIYIIPEIVNFEGENYTVTAIAEGAFAHSKITEVLIPNSITQIGAEAFLECDKLVNVTLPLYISEIPRECFLGTALVNIAIPEGVKRLGYASFESCHYLHTVMLPSTLNLIDAYAFNDCHNI